MIVLTLIFSDVLLALFIWEAAFVLQGIWAGESLSEIMVAAVSPSGITVATVMPALVVWVGIRALLGLYPGYGLDQVEELRRQTYAVLATVAVTTTFAVALQVASQMSRLALGLGFLGLLVLAPLARQFVKGRMMKVRLWGKPVVIMCSGEPGEHFAALLDREWRLGYTPVAVFGKQQASSRKRFDEIPDEKSLANAMELSRRHGVDTLVLAMPYTRRQAVAKLVNWASLYFRHVMVILNLDGVTNSAVVARDLAGTCGVEVRHNLLDPTIQRVKRALDLTATLIGGILIMPLIAALSLLVWLESRGPVFYRAQRMGRNGKPFSCIKFCTMVPDAEAVLQRMLEEDPELREEYSRYHKLRDDPRVTRVGRFLRKTSLDELPQLWNVLRGEMSLVGPRPYLPREAGDIGDTQSDILRVYPGITGPWQVGGRNNTFFGERVGMDAHYVRNWSIWLDLVILARTVKTLAFDRGAY
jgi:Undecaprenyl-phosphate galactose phosphotransferase WbaP